MDENLELDSLENESQESPDKIAQLNAQKAHYKEKLQKSEEARKAKEAEVETMKAKLQEFEQGLSKVSDTTVEIKLKNNGYDEDDIKVLKSLAIGSGKKPDEMIEDTTFKVYREGKLANQKITNAVPEPSSRVPVYDNKTFKELNHQEQKSNYGKTIETLVQKARNGNKNPF